MTTSEAQARPADDDLLSLPERTCIVTRIKGTPEDLVRFVRAPDGSVVPDIRARLPGRGAWVTGEAGKLAEALRRKAFTRAFKADVTVASDLPHVVDDLLERDALQALSLANKAGLVAAGMAKVEALVATRPLLALVQATDGSPDGRRKLDATLRRHLGPAADAVPRIQIFASGQLDLALGRTNVIHAALAEGPAGKGFVLRARRLERFRGAIPGTSDTAGATRPIED